MSEYAEGRIELILTFKSHQKIIVAPARRLRDQQQTVGEHPGKGAAHHGEGFPVHLIGMHPVNENPLFRQVLFGQGKKFPRKQGCQPGHDENNNGNRKEGASEHGTIAIGISSSTRSSPKNSAIVVGDA